MSELDDRFYGALVFTDIEGSSGLWEAHPRTFVNALNEHNRILADACARHGGRVVKEEGDAFFLAFPDAGSALRFAIEAQNELAECEWSSHGLDGLLVRIGLHVGSAWQRGEDLWGPEVNRAARICDAGHGGQLLASGDFMGELRDPGPDIVITDLRRCRLRGLAAPEHLYQLTAAGWDRQQWPTLRTLDHVPTNLPAQITSFVGRDTELQDLAELLAGTDTRLITLTGPGGSGKSRLAQEAAGRALHHFADGVYWIGLAEISSPEAVLPAVMQALQVEPVADRSPLEQIADFPHDRQLLLVLDNFEHVIDAADSIADLLRHAPGLRVMATSREVLRLPGEHVYEVPPMTIPEPPLNWQTLSQYESVRLFLRRAGEARPGFDITPENAAAVAEICSRLDGIPLALELAAAWVRMYTPRQILEQLGPQARVLTTRIRGVAERQRTLHGAIQWSYDLLDAEDQRAFRFLSIFRGGFFLDAAEAVCGPGAIDSVERLHDCSLLYCREVLDQRRFYMLETVREFGEERLADNAECEPAAVAHLEWYARLSSEVRETIDAAQANAQSRQRICTEHRNLIAALELSVGVDRGEAVRDLCVVLRSQDTLDATAAAELCPDLRRIWENIEGQPVQGWFAEVGIAMLVIHSEAKHHDTALRFAPDVMRTAVSTGIGQQCWAVARIATTAAMSGRHEDAMRHWLRLSAPYAPTLEARAHVALRFSALGMHDQAIAILDEMPRAHVEDGAAIARPGESSDRFLVAHATAVVHLRVLNLEEALAAANDSLAFVRGSKAHREYHFLSAHIPIFCMTGHSREARAIIDDVAGALAGEPPSWVCERISSMISFCLWGQMWGEAAHLSDEYMTPYPPEGLSESAAPNTAPKIAESYARVGRPDEARDRIALMLAADRSWDEQMSYYIGQDLKSLAEVLRATDNRSAAATVATVAHRLQGNQPLLQFLCQELLDLLAGEMSEADYRAALAAAEDMKPSEAIALAREALGL